MQPHPVVRKLGKASAAVAVTAVAAVVLSITAIAVTFGLAGGVSSGPNPWTVDSYVLSAANVEPGVPTAETEKAYSHLCASLRNRVPYSEFLTSRTEVISPVFRLTYAAQLRYTATPPNNEVDDPAVTEASATYQMVDLSRYPTVNEYWEITSVREDGHWRTCGFRFLEAHEKRRDEKRCVGPVTHERDRPRYC